MSAAWQQLEGSTVNGVYRLERLLGAAELSAVYQASLLRDARQFAVKLVVAREDSARILARWERASQVSHRHLIPISGLGRAVLTKREMLFAAMELADDVLAAALVERPLSPDEMRDMVGPCLEALEYLHSRGLAHGRLTPGNILAVGDLLKLSTDNVLRFGEEIRRSPGAPPDGSASAASDVWAFGKLIAAALHSDDPPEPYGEVVRGCLIADPKERWTMRAIRQHLNPPALRPARGARLVRFAVIGGLVTALVAAVLVVPRFQSDSPAEPAPAVAESRPPEPLPSPTPVAPPPEPKKSRVKEETPAPPPPEPEPQKAPEPPPRDPPKKAEKKPTEKKRREPEPAREQPAPETSAPEGAAESVVSRSMPDIAPESLRTVSGKIRVGVGVTVDEQGNVTGTSLESAGPSRYFASQAERAASRWKFTPGSAGRWVVRFEFSSAGVTASSRRAR